MRTKSRLSLAVLAFAAASWIGQSFAADDVSIRLNWYLVGFHTPLFLGKERGYYEEEGINLTINEGRGSGVAAQSVGAGSDTFGMSDGGSVVVAVAKGTPIKAIMTPMNISPFAVVASQDSGITSAADLEDKTLALSPGDSLTQLFPAVVSANNLDEDSINNVFVDPAGKVVSVLEGKADALLGAIGAQDAQLEAKGMKTHSVAFWDMGVPTIGMTIHAHRDTIAEQPDMVRRFVAATVRSYGAAVVDPEAAVDAALKAKPEQNKNILLSQLRGDVTRFWTDRTYGRTLGYGDPKAWEETVALMKKYREADTDEAAGYFYTNEFLPDAGE